MRFEVLGTVGVTDGSVLDIGTGRQRRLLAALLVHREKSLSVAELVDLVWADADELPDHPDRSLRTYVSRLRAALDGRADVIETTDDGYRFRLGDNQFDADELEHHVADAATALREARPDDAARAVDRALVLWRGHPFGGVGSELWARAESERLEELHLVANEQRLDVLASLGSHREIVAAAARLVADHPLREGFRRHLITALHRSGRTAEALRAYQDYRGWLATEVGLEPSAELKDLERRILAGDASLLVVDSARPGTRVRAYELVERIGEGAFAVVYRGTQPSVGREVAIKQIRAELANRPEFIRRFESEAHMVARLEHPHVVPLYDYWREPCSAYLVMRWLRGGTLEQRLFESALSLDEVRTMVAHVGAALAASHRAGIIHRDVKPANIFLDGDGNFFLGDFGIALAVEDRADPTSALSAGSPAYAAPEQLRREPVGPPADVHGLAIASYEALTGTLPFPDELTRAGLLQRQLHDPIPSVHTRRPEVSSAVDTIMQRATAKNPADRYARIDDFVADLVAALAGGNAPARRAGAGTVVSALDGRNPYKGLLAFDEADAAEFFGRERLVDRLISHLAAGAPGGRLLAVVGPSGSGKSSVVHAGLIPALRRGGVKGSDRWFVVSMVPSSDPFGELDAALARIATTPVPDLAASMMTDAKGIGRAVRRSMPAGGELLLVLDQFEELFTLVDDEPVRQRFIDALVAALVDPHSQLRVVLTLRADFWDRPLRYGELARLLDGSAVPVMPLAPDELERAILDPAHALGAEFEPGLLSAIVADVADQPGALPMLQYALTELWERQVSGLLTRDAYQRLGGVTGTLARRAEEVFERGTDAEQSAARRVFTRLVTLGEGIEDTRRRVRLSELGDDDATAAVVDRFGAARLLSFDRDPSTREPTMEVAHEALIREWRRLRNWLDDDRDGLRTHRHLTMSAAGWEASGRDRGELYRGGRLEAAEQWVRAHPDAPNTAETSFLDASVVHRNEDRAAERRGHRRMRRALVAVAAVAITALLAGAFAFQQRGTARSAAGTARAAAGEAAAQTRQAQAERDRADTLRRDSEIGRLVAESKIAQGQNMSLSLLLAEEAAQREDSVRAKGALQSALVANPSVLGYLMGDGVNLSSASISGDSRTLVAGRADGKVDVWDTAARRRTATIVAGPAVVRAELDDTASVMAVARADGTFALWDLRTQQAIKDPIDLGAPPLASDQPLHPWFVAGHGFLLAASDRAVLVDRNGAVVRTILEDPGVQGVAAAADGSLVAVAVASPGGTVVTAFDTTTWTPVHRVVTGLRGFSVKLVIEPRLQRLAIGFGGSGPSGRVFDLATSDPTGPIWSAQNSPTPAFSPDGSQLWTVGAGGEVVFRDPWTGAPLDDRLSIRFPETGAVYGHGVVFDHEVARAYVATYSGAIVVVDARGDSKLGRALPGVSGLAVPDGRGRRLAVVGWDGTLTTRDPTTGAILAGPVPGDVPGALVKQTALRPVFSPDGARVALGGFAGRMRIFDSATLAVTATILVPRTHPFDSSFARSLGPVADGIVGYSAWTPDGTTLVTSTFDSVVILDPTSQAVRRECTGWHTAIIGVSAGPSGDVATASDFDGTTITFRLADCETVARIPGNLHERLPDGHTLALSEWKNQTIEVRDDRTGASARGPITTLETPAILGSASDGHYLFSGSVGPGFRMYDLDSGAPVGDLFPASDTGLPFRLGPTNDVVSIGDQVTIWDVDPTSWARKACVDAGRNLTQAEWTKYLPVGETYRATCPEFPRGR